MSNMFEQVLSTIYHPCQQGYKQAGKHYMEVYFCEDIRLGRYMSEMFEVHQPEFSSEVCVIPDGCNDIIVSFDGNKVQSFLSPSISTSYKFDFNGKQWIFGVRFLPGGTYSIFQDNLEYDYHKAIDMKVLLSDFHEIEEQLCDADSFQKRYAVMMNYLERKINIDDGIQKLLHYCIKRIIITDGNVSINSLEQETGYSTRYIRQLFDAYVGHSPKTLANIIRMQKTLQYLWKNPSANLGETAFIFGFADQSHMNRDFKKFLNTTSGMIKEDDRWILKLDTKNSRTFI